MTDFSGQLEKIAKATQDELGRALERHAGGHETLLAAMRHASLGGGKRLRPFLLVSSARLFGVSESEAIPAAAALEALHCYSLVHDDLPAMDDDDLRRGRPTVHIAFDEATAILAGDGLLTLAFRILASKKTHPDANIRCELISHLARAGGANGMIAGQMRDLEAEKTTPGLKETILMQRQKTGALIEFACEAGAILGGAGEIERKALRSYAADIGLAFQIADDLLDFESSPDIAGKRTGKDERAGKATFVSLMGAENARSEAQRRVRTALEALASFDRQADPLREAAKFIITRKS